MAILEVVTVILTIWLAFALAASAWAQDFSFTPKSILQGEALKVHGDKNVTNLRMGNETAPMFQQADNSSFGLFPIPLEERPGNHELQFLNRSGSILYSIAVLVRNAHYGTQNIVLSRSLTALKASPDEKQTMEAFRKRISVVRYWEEPLVLPVSGCMTSSFGVRRLHNGKPTGDYHRGIDQRAAAGAGIRAVAAGVVQVAHQFELRGGTVAIDHGQGLESVYFHMSEIAAHEGALVQKGEIIGYVGSTGRSTAPHLHWALYVDGQPVNPQQWVNLKPCAVTRPRSQEQTPRKHG